MLSLCTHPEAQATSHCSPGTYCASRCRCLGFEGRSLPGEPLCSLAAPSARGLDPGRRRNESRLAVQAWTPPSPRSLPAPTHIPAQPARCVTAGLAPPWHVRNLPVTSGSARQGIEKCRMNQCRRTSRTEAARARFRPLWHKDRNYHLVRWELMLIKR